MAKIATEKMKLENVLREMVRDVILEELISNFKPGNLEVPTEEYFEPEDREDEEEFWASRHELEPQIPSREEMLDAMLELEFQQEKKSVAMPVLREMIRESVRRIMVKK